ncbi:MAG: DinB family protein [Chloroflexota bacterium]
MTMTDKTDSIHVILAQYADGPSLLDTALAGLSETDLDLAPSADEWSIRQIVHHIVDGDDLWKTCIKIALGNSDAVFSLGWYAVKSQEEWSESWAYPRRSLDSSIALYRANRAHIVDLLEHVPGALEKSIRFDRPGKEEMRITVFDVVELHVQHLEEHIASIKAIRQGNQR